MAEAVLGAFIPVLLEKLANKKFTEYFGRLKSLDKKELEKWAHALTYIEAVLSDAEEKQVTERAVKKWLDDLRDLAYDIQDVLDVDDTDMPKQSIESRQGSKSKFWFSPLKAKSNYTLNSTIKKISDRLVEITTVGERFGLNKHGVSRKPWKMPPTSCLLDGPVIGRDEAKAKIVDDLLSKQEDFHVVGIVGTGGLGKTTLAKHVYNDAAADQFSPKGWVCVSDDFDIVRVAKAVLESVTSDPIPELKELDSILQKISKELAGKKFLIVLDDVWHTCSYDQWTILQSSFRDGAAGSKIIMTTRDVNVAMMMGDRSPFNLNAMSQDDCWKIFNHHALLKSGPEDAEFLKEKIVEKCNGLPLAAKTLGGLLRRKRVDEWEGILDHKMWTLSDDSNKDILPALKLSYHYLPSTLKLCFSYCAAFPNDYEFQEKDLILWWMAEGLIPLQQHEEHKLMEDLGHDYFQELVSRSLFQKSSKGESKYIMHDLVMDLARWAAGSSCARLEDMQNHDSQRRCLSNVRHSSYIPGEYEGVKKFEVYSKATHLRMFMQLPQSRYIKFLARKVSSELLPRLRYLRLLSLYNYKNAELPDSIGELKHLRYLDLSYTRIESLPDSTTALYNLQTLLLEGCAELKALPRGMRNLVNLRHLNISDTSELKEMPPQLGQLSNLQTLTKFIVGNGNGSKVSEIGSLLHLQGTLHISRLENVICIEDAMSAKLKSKERLEFLLLEWSSSSVSTEGAAVVLDMLQPHTKLKKLQIKGYLGLRFSTWIGNPIFVNMVHVRLEGCNHCRFLPPLGKLPALKEVVIQDMDAVESVGVEFYGDGHFPALQTLEIQNMKIWNKWSHSQHQSQGVEVFPCLERLSISKCPKLEGDLPEKLDSLKKLNISSCEELVVSVSKYKHLKESKIGNCKMVVYNTDPVQFDRLQNLTLANIPELRFQTEVFMKGLKNVEELRIIGCEELTRSFQNEDRLLQHMTSLRKLYIVKCSSLVSFPDVGLPPCLQVIEILECESLEYFAKYRIPPSLQRIKIKTCEKLKSLIEKEEDEVGDGSSSCLQSLVIEDCPALMCLIRKIQFPRSLKQLYIYNCQKLELITEMLLDETCQLEMIDISDCPSLKSLPDGLCDLINLQLLWIQNCESLVSLPKMNVWPRELLISSCKKLDGGQLVRDMMHASNVEELTIDYCEGLSSLILPNLTSLTIDYCEGLSSLILPNLTSLTIYDMKNCKALMESQVLQRLTSLRELRLWGDNEEMMVSFPPAESLKEMEKLLPTSLVSLRINGFRNLKKLSKGFQFLTSLQSLVIRNCPKLKTLPVECLPLSLNELEISGCPLLEKRCKGQYRPKLAHIPCVRIHSGFL